MLKGESGFHYLLEEKIALIKKGVGLVCPTIHDFNGIQSILKQNLVVLQNWVEWLIQSQW